MSLHRVVIFGAWREGVSLYFDVRTKVEVIAFIDNNPDIQSQKIYGIEIMSPNNLNEIDYDEIYISSTKSYQQMYIQLVEMGISKEKIKIVFGIDKIKKDLNLYGRCLKNKSENFEIEWSKLRKKYKKIQVFSIDVSSIGEMITRFWRILEKEFVIDSTLLRVYFPVVGNKGRISNRKLIELMEQKVMIVFDHNIDFWRYVLDMHSDEIETFEYNQYLYRGELPNCFVPKDYTLVKFRESQIELGKKKLREMGILGEYVCIMARTSNYAMKTLKDKREADANIAAHEFRDSDFYEYKDTINYFKTINIQTVKVGRGEEPIEDIDNCVDYAGGNTDDFMDIFLMANCKLMIVGGGSGIYALATSFSRPVLFVNYVPVTFGCGGCYFTENDLFIPKKMCYKNSNEYLSLLEIADIDRCSMHNGLLYDKNGVIFEDNTSGEILDAVKEILDRINGSWEDTAEDIQLLQQYESIISISNYNLRKDIYKYNWAGGALPVKISVKYLKNNLYLLEDKGG